MRYILSLLLLYAVGFGTNNYAQTESIKQAVYPRWFWEMPRHNQAIFAVGYARRYTRLDTSFAMAREQCAWQLLHSQQIAIEANRKLFSRSDKNRLVFNAQDVHIDSSLVTTIIEGMAVLDSAIVGNMAFVLASYPAADNGVIAAARVPVPPKPQWLETLPNNEDAIYAIGTSQLYFYLHHSWERAESNARYQLASVLASYIRGVNQQADNRQQIWSESQTSAVLRKASVVNRWLDVENRQCYVLCRMRLK